MGAIWNQPVLNFFPIMLIGFAQSLTSDAAVGCRQIKSLSPECGIWRCDALLKVVNFGPPKKSFPFVRTYEENHNDEILNYFNLSNHTSINAYSIHDQK